MSKIIALMITASLLWVFSGCSHKDSTYKSPPAPINKTANSTEAPQREVWDVCFIQGVRAGYLHTAYYRDAEAGKPVLRIEGLTHIVVKRFGENTQQEIRCTSIETPQGQLLRFETEMQMGNTPLRTAGRVVAKRLEMETVSQGKNMPGVIDWSPDYGGFYAVEQSLLCKPMQPGEKRSLQTLVAGFNQLATVEMAARDWEDTPLLHGTYKLLRIDTLAIFSSGQKMEQTLWTDRTGDELKTHSAEMSMETFRSTKAETLEKSDVANLDIGLSTTVKLDKPLPKAHDTKRAVYRVHLDAGDPAAVFVTGSTQQVKSIDANSAEVTVYAVRPEEKKGTGPIYGHQPKVGRGREGAAHKLDLSPFSPDPPTAADSEPNNWIQSDDKNIIALANEAADGDWLGSPERKTVPVPLSQWDTAVRLEQFVHNYIKKVNYSQVFATAAEVAETREGDCTEHAVLLAALCRARKIPARVAIGLVYMPATQEFGYHMWTEVYLMSPLPLGEGQGEGQWIPIDATLGKGGIGAAHLKLAHASLKGASAYSSFLPVVKVVGRLKIEVIDAE